jgi:hypothetical protein
MKVLNKKAALADLVKAEESTLLKDLRKEVAGQRASLGEESKRKGGIKERLESNKP